MDPIKTMGITVRARAVGDNDMMLTVISEDLGRISIWAKGVKSLKHKAHASASPLCYSEFVIKPRRDVYILSEASLCESFYGLRSSLEGLAEAMYFAALAETVSAEGVEAGDILKLLLNSLYFLEHKKKEQLDLRLMFEIKLLGIAGFLPELGGCGVCGDKNALYFDAENGEMLCGRCVRNSAVKVSAECARLISLYSSAPLKTALNFKGEREYALEGIRLLQRFLAEHVGVVKARDYLNNIIGV